MAGEQQAPDQQIPEQPTSAAEDLAARVQELGEQLAAAQDQALCMVADLQSVCRRTEQNVEKTHGFALEKLAGDLPAVTDTLERGLEMSDPNNEAIKPMREGMKLTPEMFDDILRRYQVEVPNPEGKPLNPEQHQVMAVQESVSVGPDSVLKVFQKGYLPSGRLLRPAMVVVSRTSVETPPSIDERA